MREIKVRGYAVEEMVNDQWMYGTGIHKTVFTDEYAAKTGVKEEWFIFTEYGWVQVEPKPTGQYTGLKDKNGVEIYEGDFLKSLHGSNKGTYKVVWYRSGFQIQYDFNVRGYDERNFFPIYEDSYVVIGNIYENPELLGDSN